MKEMKKNRSFFTRERKFRLETAMRLQPGRRLPLLASPALLFLTTVIEISERENRHGLSANCVAV